MKTTLVCVVNGEIYEKFAEDLFMSASDFFHPTEEVEFVMMYGRAGWPAATMYRYHTLGDHMPDADYVFMSDADMLFEAEVGPEVIPDRGLAATLHPGYAHRTTDLPYEKREGMWTKPAPGADRYYCGGFIGGTRSAMLALTSTVSMWIDHDMDTGRTPVWHDESALNAVLSHEPPNVTLSPSYCYPDDDTYYKTIWNESYERKLVALDKTQDQRGNRG